MRRSGLGLVVAGVALVGALASVRCADPTAVVVEVYSEVPCAANARVVLLGARTAADLAGAPPSAEATKCEAVGGGSVRRGTVVVTPAGSNDDPIAFAIVTRPDGVAPDATCLSTASSSCIVAKRQLRFLPRTTLSMRVDLRTQCLGVRCDERSTCVKGTCVDASLSGTLCAGTKCDESTLPGADAGTDGPVADAGPDADASPDGSVPACDRAKPFGPRTHLAQLGSPSADVGMSVTTDELLGFFYSERGGVRVHSTSRTSTSLPFGAPATLPLAGSGNDVDPSVTGDGLALVFASDRAGGLGGFDLWLASRSSRSDAFGAPTRLVSVSSAENDVAPFVTSDGLALYFARGVAGAFDLFTSRRPSVVADFGAPTAMASLNSIARDTKPVVSADELVVYLASNRDSATLDIWRAERATTTVPFGPPFLVTELATEGDDVPGWVSADDCTLYYTATLPPNASELFVARRPP